ncbi:hypothetical protein EJ377_04780 [Chryseobacterium arthrosphaerae]|uniref:Glycosyl hydrolase family 92 domain-containing protein n=1 Tax=Chryseobacterium arthrosphaerae TaxID=651561 RepID=A0A432E1E5_9FLAO|nr:hypothetical protein EJ377_04780 [Chryseobacterium arthrosphaerae]
MDYYTVFSLWDTFRGAHPLMTLIDRKRTADFINTFIRQYEQEENFRSGNWPPMKQNA